MFLITRRDNLCPKTGLEPVIALLEGKCLNHLNYSGSYNCCTRLFSERRNMEDRLEWLTGFEPATFWMAIKCSTNWATATYGISGARAGPALSSVTTPEIGADSPIRTDVDFRLVVTNHVQSTTMRYRHMDPVMVIETTSTVWKTVILAVELHRVI